jgi:hypothetical protein
VSGAKDGLAGRAGSAISVFATMPDGTRRWERYASRNDAASGIRDCRSKGGADFNIYDPWMPKQSPNAPASATGQEGKQ